MVICDTTDKETKKQAQIIINQWVARTRVRVFPHEKQQLIRMVHENFQLKKAS